MSETGRYYIIKNGRKFCIEPIDNSEGKSRKKHGDIDPVTKKLQGNYGDKHRGSIREEDSIITEDNGFKNIVTLGVGESPNAYIDNLITKEDKECQQ